MSQVDARDAEGDASSAATHAADLDLTAFQFRILVHLHGRGEDYGLGIKRALEDYYGVEQNHGRLYPNLDQLGEANLVRKTPRDKRTNNYELTDAGQSLVEEELDQLAAIADYQPGTGAFEWGGE